MTIVMPASRQSLRLPATDRKSTRLNSSHLVISYAVFCLKKKILRLVARHQITLHQVHQQPTPPTLLDDPHGLLAPVRGWAPRAHNSGRLPPRTRGIPLG